MHARIGIVKKSIVIALFTIGLATGSTFLMALITQVYAKTPYAAIVIGTSESQNISCSTGSSKNTHGLQFSAHTRTGTLNGYWDIASAFTGAENKGGYVYEGRSDGKTYELKVKETQDGICHAEVP